MNRAKKRRFKHMSYDEIPYLFLFFLSPPRYQRPTNLYICVKVLTIEAFGAVFTVTMGICLSKHGRFVHIYGSIG